MGDQKRREREVSQASANRQQRRSVTRQPDHSPTGDTVNKPDIDQLQKGRKAKQKAAEEKLLTFVADNGNFAHSEAAAAVGRSRPWVTGKLKELAANGVIIKQNGQGYTLRGYDETQT